MSMFPNHYLKRNRIEYSEMIINAVSLFCFSGQILKKGISFMRNEKALRKSVSILVGLTVMILALVRGKWQPWLLLGIFTVWGLWLVGVLPVTNLYERIKAKLRKRKSLESAKQMLVRYLNKRITAILRKSHSNASWKWCDADPSVLALNGGKAYIRLYGVPGVAYGEVTVTSNADVSVQLLNPCELPGRVNVVDPYTWYEEDGKDVLNNMIMDLDSRGVNSLTMNEYGDIWVHDVREHRFSEFPDKDDWSFFLQIFKDNGLDAEIVNDSIVLSW